MKRNIMKIMKMGFLFDKKSGFLRKSACKIKKSDKVLRKIAHWMVSLERYMGISKFMKIRNSRKGSIIRIFDKKDDFSACFRMKTANKNKILENPNFNEKNRLFLP